MANERPNPQAPALPALPPEPRRANSEGVDRKRSDSNPRRDSQLPASKAASNSPNQREHGGSGGRPHQAASVERDRELPVSPARSGRNPFSTGDNILQAIADRFNEAHELNSIGAWRQLQKDLMDAAQYLVPTLMPYKEILDKVWDIEDRIKGSQGGKGKSNEELMADFLRGGNLIPIDKGIDNSATVGKGDEAAIVSAPTGTVNIPSR